MQNCGLAQDLTYKNKNPILIIWEILNRTTLYILYKFELVNMGEVIKEHML